MLSASTCQWDTSIIVIQKRKCITFFFFLHLYSSTETASPALLVAGGPGSSLGWRCFQSVLQYSDFMPYVTVQTTKEVHPVSIWIGKKSDFGWQSECDFRVPDLPHVHVLDCRGKRENLVKTHADPGRTCKLNSTPQTNNPLAVKRQPFVSLLFHI